VGKLRSLLKSSGPPRTLVLVWLTGNINHLHPPPDGTHIYGYTHTHAHTHTHKHTHSHTRTHAYTHARQIYTHKNVCMHISMHTATHIQTYTCTYTHAHTRRKGACTHTTHTHTHTQPIFLTSQPCSSSVNPAGEPSSRVGISFSRSRCGVQGVVSVTTKDG
jgi:hypothetical protein